MKSLKVEYLVVIKKKGAFCDKVETFLNFLKSDSRISVQKTRKTLSYVGKDKETIKVNYEIQKGEVEDQRFFHIKFLYELTDDDPDTQIELYRQLLKTVKTNIHRLNVEFHVIWDDMSLRYAQLAYPLIYDIENLMRKLIIKFMVATLGIGWVDETLPDEVKSIVNRTKSRREDSSSFLYKIDFIDLAKFLLEPYQTVDANELYKKINKIQALSELELDYLKSFVPKSNWQRYFSAIIDYDSERFKKKWNELYLLRCKVAHNNHCTPSDYSKIVEIIDELREKLDEAIEKLDKIEITEEEREEVAESISTNMNSLYGEFLKRWKYLERQIDRILPGKKGDKRKISVRWKIQRLAKELILPKNIYLKAIELNDFRNRIVHAFDFKPTEAELLSYIDVLDALCAELETIPPTESSEK
ncbi:MAG: hypothetical protein AAFN40_15140 [Cyanobacteria bacterium J06560_6]